MSEQLIRPFPAALSSAKPLDRTRACVAVAGVGAVAAALLLSPSFVESVLISTSAVLDDRDVTCIQSVRFIFGVLGVALLAMASSWRKTFAQLSTATQLSFFTPLAILAAVVGSKILYFGADPGFYRWITREDSLAEWVTWVAYLGAALWAFPVARHFRAAGHAWLAALYLLLGIGLFAVAMEEISWGQRLFAIETPAAFAENVQGELTVHNMPSFQRYLHSGYIAVGLVAAFAWMLLPIVRRVRSLAWLEWVTPPWTLATWFLPVAVVYLFFELAPLLRGNDGQEFFGCFTWNDQELMELLLSIGFLAFVASVRGRQRGAVAPSRAPARMTSAPQGKRLYAA